MRKVYPLIVLALLCSTSLLAQLSGPKSIGSGGDYATIADAVNDLNTQGVGAGGVTFTVASGHTESITAPILLTATGSAADPIVFKGAAGVNPKVTRTDAGSLVTTTLGAQGDAVIIIQGGDYISFDKIDVAASDMGIEYGYYLRKASATNGCKNVTISGAAITMTKGTSQYVVGIYSSNNDAASLVSSATGITVTSTGGRNENITLKGNTISSCFAGIILRGYNHTSSPYDYYDQNFTVGASGEGNIIQNIAGNANATSYGIYAIYHNNLNASYNTINNAAGGGTGATSTYYGIFMSTGTNSSFTATNNIVTSTSASTTSTTQGIRNDAATGALIMDNNTVVLSNSASSSGTYAFLYNGGSLTNISISNNNLGASTFTTTATGYMIYNSVSYTGTATIQNNATTGAITKNGVGTWYGYYDLSSPTGTLNCSGNTFNGISVTGASTLTIINVNTVGAHTLNVFNNTISNISGGSSTITGISSTASNIKNIYGNTIHTISGTGSVIGVLVSTGSTSSAVYKNKIYGLSSTTTTGTVYGISVTTNQAATNIYNNLIGNLTAPSGSNGTTDIIRGISLTATTSSSNVNVSFNTIYLNASGGTNFSASGIFHTYSSTATSSSLFLRNNIIVNTSTQSGTGVIAAFRRSASTDLNNYNTASNYNLFYVGTTSATKGLYYNNTTMYQTMATFKAAVGTRESASFSENPPFLSTTGSDINFLHIDPTIATQIESGGTSIGGITDDYDGNVRDVTTPDIGADEGSFTIMDINGPSISYTALTNTICTSNRTINAIIIDASDVNVTAGTKPRLYFKRSTDANTYNDNTSGTDGWKYTEATNATSPFAFTMDYSLLNGGTGAAAGQTIQYFIVAQDLNGTPNLSINSGTFAVAPSSVALTAGAFPIGGTINSFNVVAGIASTVTIGAAGTYPTITGTGGLFEAINNSGLGANTTATILDASVTETGSVALNQITYGCATYTLTIKPATGVDAVLTGSVGTGAIIKLNGADNVTIDGSNNGTTSRNLTIRNTTSTTSGNAVVWLASPASGNGSTNNTVKNAIIEGNSSTTTFLGMYIGGSGSISLTAAGSEQNNSNTITNNLFRKTQYGIALFGYAAGIPDDNNVISNNNFGTSVAGEGFNIEAVHADRQNNLVVSGNEVQNVKGTSGTTMYGIRLLDFKNGQAYNNKVHDVAYTGTSTTKNYGIAVQSSTYTTAGNPSQALIYNNVVYAINSSGTSAVWNATGILASQGYGDKYYYNSINMSGQINNSSSGLSAAFAIGDDNITSTGTNLDIRNNIIVLSGSSASGGNVWAFYTRLTSYTGFIQNNNIIRAAGTGATNNIGRFNSTNYTTLAAWQTATGMDANSIESDPLFNSTSNLTPQLGSPAVGAGTPIGGITTDILGTVRSITTPTIGAYETAQDAVGPAITYTAIASTLCLTAPVLSATITDVSGVNITAGTKPRLYFKKSTNANSLPLTNDNTTDGWKYVEASNALSPFTFTVDYSIIFGGVAAGETIQYFVTAQDLASTPNVSINTGTATGAVTSAALTGANFPVTGMNSYNLIANGLGTDVTIGAAGDYTSLSGAAGLFATLNSGGLTANVTATIMDATVAETGATVLNAVNYGCGGPFTLTIKPGPGVTTELSGSSTSPIIRLNGASNIVIDGSNTVGGTTRDLTITNTGAGAASGVAFIAAASNVTVKNIKGGTSASTVGYGIVFDASTNGRVENCEIKKAVLGIQGQNNTNGLVVENNDLGGGAVSADALLSAGIVMLSTSNFTIHNNRINGVTRPSTASIAGINISTGNGGTGVISNNNITNIKHTGADASAYSAYGIQLNNNNAASDITVKNNFISDISGLGDNGSTNGVDWAPHGIIIQQGGGYKIYHNTVNMYAEISNPNATEIIRSGALTIMNGTGVGNLDIRNNVLVNASFFTVPGTDRRSYAIISNAPNTVFTQLDNNLYYVSGADGILGNISSTDRITLADIVTGFGGNAASSAAQPNFVSATDLHLTTDNNCALSGTGAAVGVTTDIDGDARNATTPDIGADEFSSTFALTITNPASVCTGSTVNLTAPAVTAGSTSGDPLSYWTDAAATSALATPAAVGSSGTYYIKLTKGSCSNVKAVVVTIDPVSVGGTATADQTICSGTAPADITLSGNVGNILKWEASPNAGFGVVSDINVTSATLPGATIGNLTQTRYFRAVVQSGACSPTTSNAVIITVDPVSVGGTVAGAQTICAGTQPGTDLVLSGNTGNIVKWQKASDAAFTSPTDIASVSATLTGAVIGNLSANTYFRAVVQSGVCSQANSASVLVTVDPVSVGGTVAGTQSVCSGTQPGTDLVLSGNTGNVVKWQKASDAAFTSPTDIASTSTTLTGAVIGNLSASTYFRAVVQSGVCSQANSASVLVTVDPVSVGGTVSGTQTICAGTQPGTDLVLSGNTGNVVKWQKASDAAFTSPTDIASTATTLTGAVIGNLSATTYFRAVVQSGVCSQANSASVLVTVDPVSVGGTVSGTQTICAGTQPGTDLVLSGNTGNVVKWQKASDAAFTSPTDIASTATTLTGAVIGNLGANTYFRAVVQSGVCGSANSASVLITVSANTVAGSVSGAQTICIGNAPISDLVLSGNTGSVVKWQKASDVAFTSPVDIASTATTLTSATIGAINANTYFRAVVQSGACASANTTGVLIGVNTTVNNATALAGVAGGSSVCANYSVATSNNFLNNCDLIATVTPGGASPVSGNVNACVKIDASVQTAPTGEPYVQRHFDILPASNATTATSTITLYFTQAEFNAFNVAKGFYAALPTGAGDAAGIANLRVTQYNGIGTAPGNYSGTAVQIDPLDADISYNATAGRWSVSFAATGSGGFYVHTGKFTLPVTLLEFKGEISGDINKLSWKTATEINNRGFEVERSADGKNFSSIGYVATKAENGNSTSVLTYGLDDVKPLQGNNYYRLKQIDRDGKISYSQVVVLTRKVMDITLSGVYPNPTTRELNVVITSPRAEKVTIIITDLTGKVLMQQPAQLMIGENRQKLDVLRFAAGTYVIKAICANGCETAVNRFVKQ